MWMKCGRRMTACVIWHNDKALVAMLDCPDGMIDRGTTFHLRLPTISQILESQLALSAL